MTASHVDSGSVITDGDRGVSVRVPRSVNLRVSGVGGNDKGPGVPKSGSQYYTLSSLPLKVRHLHQRRGERSVHRVYLQLHFCRNRGPEGCEGLAKAAQLRQLAARAWAHNRGTPTACSAAPPGSFRKIFIHSCIHAFIHSFLERGQQGRDRHRSVASPTPHLV